MKALVFNKPHEMVVTDMPKPEIGEGEALIAVKYCGICGTDVTVFNGGHATAKYPVIPGHEFVGELVEIKGAGSDMFKIGDRVCAQEVVSCGHCAACARGEDNVCENLQVIGVHTNGGFAEYVRVKANKMYKLPDNVDLKTAAIVEPLAVAVHDVRRSGLQVGETALVVGAGPIGLLVALVARCAGARKVVVSEAMPSRRAFAEKLGFPTVDPLSTDFTARMAELSERGFAVSFETGG